MARPNASLPRPPARFLTERTAFSASISPDRDLDEGPRGRAAIEAHALHIHYPVDLASP